MMKKLILILIIAVAISGCVSRVFSIGHENFVCNGDTAGGQCIDTDTVYKRRAIFAAQKADTDNTNNEKTTKNISLSRDDNGETESLRYVYEPPKILKVKVSKFKSSNGDLVDDTYIYIKADEGRWKDADGRIIKE